MRKKPIRPELMELRAERSSALTAFAARAGVVAFLLVSANLSLASALEYGNNIHIAIAMAILGCLILIWSYGLVASKNSSLNDALSAHRELKILENEIAWESQESAELSGRSK